MNKTKEKGKNRMQKTEVRYRRSDVRSQKADFSHQTSENGIIGFKQDVKMVDVGT